MINEFESAPLECFIAQHPQQDLARRVLGSSPVKELMEQGCYIAGGFGRALLNKTPLEKYLGIDLSPGTPPGDVDLFFEDAGRKDEFTKIFGSSNRSWGGNAVERGARATLSTQFRVQLVDHPNLILSVQDQLSRFDFLNAAVAIVQDRVIFPKRFWELEEKRLIHIQRGTSPFLVSRIMKYFKYRGIEGVTPESESIITEWIIRAMCQDFDIDVKAKILTDSLHANIRALLAEKRLSRADDLLLVLGKFSTMEKGEEYGSYKQVDFALKMLNDRGFDVTVPGF